MQQYSKNKLRDYKHINSEWSVYMKFKRDDILRRKYLGLIFIVVVGELLAFILYLINNLLVDIFLYIVATGVVCIGSAIIFLVSHSADVIMDNDGIRCINRDNLLWGFKWPEIEELKYSCAYRAKAVCVISKDNTANFKDQMGPTDAYFQLGNTAKKAMAYYCTEREDGSFVASNPS